MSSTMQHVTEWAERPHEADRELLLPVLLSHERQSGTTGRIENGGERDGRRMGVAGNGTVGGWGRRGRAQEPSSPSGKVSRDDGQRRGAPSRYELCTGRRGTGASGGKDDSQVGRRGMGASGGGEDDSQVGAAGEARWCGGWASRSPSSLARVGRGWGQARAGLHGSTRWQVSCNYQQRNDQIWKSLRETSGEAREAPPEVLFLI